jgi:hypothetical protein
MRNTSFSKSIQKTILKAFSSPNSDPDSVAKFIIDNIRPRIPLVEEIDGMKNFIKDNNIDKLVHFTPIKNIPNIMRYGLIPRKHLDQDLVRLALDPVFTDNYRQENIREANCLSITSPNYKMFYSKRNISKCSWAVLSIDPLILLQIHFTFTDKNAATKAPTIDGINGLQKCFHTPPLRERLNLDDNMPTNPQAEALEDSIIPPNFIKKIIVNNAADSNHLKQHGLTSEINSKYFAPRKDYQHW